MTRHLPTDRRLAATNGRVAHSSLEGLTEAARFTDGEAMQPAVPMTALLSAPGGPRERELVFGEPFRVLEVQGDHAFGFAERDGYVGYVAAAELAPQMAATHRVSAARSYMKATPDLKHYEATVPLSFGARLCVTGTEGRWAMVAMPDGSTLAAPRAHLAPLDAAEDDPVAVAERFLGTPYLWGGNSGFGIDCSGLVQAALLACGVPCPGDSDLQQSLGIAASHGFHRGDLVFWKGHVAMVVDDTRLIHANATDMAVVHEGIEACISRISAQDEGPVTAHRRLA